VEHVAQVLSRAVARLHRRELAPLDPDAFLAWVYRASPECHIKGSQALTVDDIWFEWSRRGPVDREDLRRQYVHLAAYARRQQRLGRDPFDMREAGLAPVPRRWR
jgi:hypothetical protein